MSLNRVIGCEGKIPWHLPEDFRWFKRMTLGGAVLMGRKTWDSLGKPLPGRTNLVVTRGAEIPGVTIVRDLAAFDAAALGVPVFVIGGAEIYRQLLPRCAHLYVTIVQREVPGDVVFPPFEEQFEFVETVMTQPEFEVRHYRHL